MAPRITLIRHAQGLHNLSVANQSIHDPLLTAFGEEQCRELSQAFPYYATLDLIVCSPLRRTIYTALNTFNSYLTREALPAVVALPELQETSGWICDTGTDVAELRHQMHGKPVDLALVVDGWNSKQGRWSPDPAALRERARCARSWLRARPEKEIAVVSHGAFLHYLTNDWEDFDKEAETGWKNVEFRTFEFRSESDSDAFIDETASSRSLRKQRGELRDEDVDAKPNRTAKKVLEQEIVRPKQAKVFDRRDWIGAF